MYMLKRIMETGSKGKRFRSILVVCQFTLSVAMIAFALLVYQQLRYMRQKDLGFDKDSVIIVDKTTRLEEQKHIFLEEVQRHSQVVTVGFAQTFPGRLWGFWQSSFYIRPGEVPAQGEDATTSSYNLNGYYGDAGFVPAMGIELVTGRNFSIDRTADSSAVLVNEAAVRTFGWEDPLGMPLYRREQEWHQEENGEWKSNSIIKEYRVIGIVKDFHYMPVQSPIDPLIVLQGFEWLRCAVIRVRPWDIQTTLKAIKAVWKQLQPKYPFVYFFLDEEFEATYQRDLHFGVLVGFFTALSIVIACLGIFGLAAYTAERRTKENGIRKVMGASVQDIVLLLCMNTVKWVGIACVVGLPVAFLAIHKWLQNFAYRIHIGLPVFFLAGIAALVIALLSVSTQAIRAATSNPVNALRNE
jgi:putative ABC transport system permease protein